MWLNSFLPLCATLFRRACGAAAVLVMSLVCCAPAWSQSGLNDVNRALLKRAETGDAQAQFELGQAYDFGQGAPLDEAQALRWYLAAAEKGLVEAQNSAGGRLMAQRKFDQALPWFEKAAARDNVQSINSLAFLYDTGQGTTQNRARARELYSKAADLGWAESMWNLANWYGTPLAGGQPDFVLSCIWALRAARYTEKGSHIHANVAKAVPVYEKVLSDEQKAACQKQGDEWVAPLAKTAPTSKELK